MRWVLVLTFVLTMTLSSQAEAALKLGSDDVTEALQNEFVEQGVDGEVEIEIFGGKTSFDLPNAQVAKILFSNFSLDEEQNRFTTDAEIFADGNPLEKTKLVGRYFIATEVWLPAVDIAKDEVIKEDNLEPRKIRSNRLREDDIISKGELVGKQAIRNIKAGKPVSKRDIREEIIIKKGNTVLAVYTHKGLQITSKLEALEDGAKGSKIKLLNTKSQKEILGEVVDKNTVKIMAE